MYWVLRQFGKQLASKWGAWAVGQGIAWDGNMLMGWIQREDIWRREWEDREATVEAQSAL